MKKNNPIAALFLCAAVVSVMLFSSLYIVHEADHECIGEDCQICLIIENCEQNLKKLMEAALAVAITIALIHTFRTYTVYFGKMLSQNTLVTLKVKLSN